jgi:hypothetical protein
LQLQQQRRCRCNSEMCKQQQQQLAYGRRAWHVSTVHKLRNTTSYYSDPGYGEHSHNLHHLGSANKLNMLREWRRRAA